MSSEIVADPVGHISISGVHGRDELNERLEKGSRAARRAKQVSVAQIVASAVVGALVMHVIDAALRRRRRRNLWRL